MADDAPKTSDTVRLIVAISSRALFDLTESHRIFETQGVRAYHEYQVAHESEILEPGVAFPLVRKLMNLNAALADRGRVEVILLSRNSSDTGLRVLTSAHHHGLDISRAAFTGGASPYRYVAAFGAHLFLSADPEDVRLALAAGCAAATVLPSSTTASHDGDDQVRIAFDGDAVLFSDDAERLYREQGLAVFNQSESAAAHEPLREGPFKGLLFAIHQLQALFPADAAPLRTALVTARGAPSHERVIRTLRAWGIRIDEALFLGGLSKARFLAAFSADIFFDDQTHHCEAARLHVATGHVPHGVANM
ncbi:5'-nucleotidase [Thiocystis violacea]|uniref:5'-nucleotidase n=1 Tax=Thiocystis violacea TaxID=13725 RepID=UPI001908B880|nr:5'-nucleotidase [Thiocystis violacea]MBK1721986.1 5'-nucleotidase [Thiocystis violacea]